MGSYKVDFYKNEKGEKPVLVFLHTLNTKLKAKVISRLVLLEEYGDKAAPPLSKKLQDGIFELRTSQGNIAVRILYFFDNDRIIIATNGFVKKSQKTPPKEILIAKKRRNNYFCRKEKGTYE